MAAQTGLEFDFQCFVVAYGGYSTLILKGFFELSCTTKHSDPHYIRQKVWQDLESL